LIRVALLMSILAVPRNHEWLERPASEGDLLRGYALGRCLAKAYDKMPFADDAEAAADAYLQMGSFSKPNGLYEQVSNLAGTAGAEATKRSPQANKNLAVFNCIEFYESPKLKALAKKVR
jgi:Type VI secretion system (T6SS), amidase immunity protein